MQSIQELVERALAHIAQADSLAALDQARVQYVGKSGELTAQMKIAGRAGAGGAQAVRASRQYGEEPDRGSDRTAARGAAGNGEAGGAGARCDASRDGGAGRGAFIP